MYDEFVTSYTVMYNTDSSASFAYVTDGRGEPRLFRGSVDSTTPARQIFDVPVEARVVRISPQKWNGAISLKMELVGCQEPGATTAAPKETCTDPMGLSDGRMVAEQVLVSSETGPEHDKTQLSVGGESGWQPITNSPTEWVEVPFCPRISVAARLERFPVAVRLSAAAQRDGISVQRRTRRLGDFLPRKVLA